jgi:hypothetical protein
MKTLLQQLNTSNFWTVNWYYLVAVTISASGLIVAYRNYKKKGGTGNPAPPDERHGISLHNSNSIPITIINGSSQNATESQPRSDLKTIDDKKKDYVKILFIDDNHTDYKMVPILKKAGWLNTRSVKDVTDLDSHVVAECDIIFVDINGVGSNMFEDQGLGLAAALKTKYPQKKIVIYSAETSGDRFHKALRLVDGCLSKNAEPYQFIDLVENLSK